MDFVKYSRKYVVDHSTPDEELAFLNERGQEGLRLIERQAVRDHGPIGGKIWYLMAEADGRVYEYKIKRETISNLLTVGEVRVEELILLDHEGAEGWLRVVQWNIPKSAWKDANKVTNSQKAHVFVREVVIEVDPDLVERAKSAVMSGKPKELRAVARKFAARQQQATMGIINGDKIELISRFVVDAANIRGWRSLGNEPKDPDATSDTTAKLADEPITFSEFSPGEL